MAEAEDGLTRFTVRPAPEMPALVRDLDWSKTPLGPREGWSQSLKLALDIVLSSGFPTALRWGPEFVLIYNDGYKPILGDKHPWALGKPAREAWSEVWPQIEPFHRQILGGETEAVFAEDTLLRIRRHGGQWEDARFTLGYSPTPDPTAPGGIGGIFVTAIETTQRVEVERQLRDAQEALSASNRSLEGERAFLRELFQFAPSFMAVVRGSDHRFEMANDAFTQLIGGRETAGRTVLEALPELAGQEFIANLDRVFATGEAFTGRGLLTRLQRQVDAPSVERFLDLRFQPFRGPGGDVQGVFVDGFDITERVVAEGALRRLNDTLEHQVRERTRERDRLWSNSQDLLVVVDAKGVCRAANPAWTTILGWTEQEVVGRDQLPFVHPDDYALARRSFALAVNHERAPPVEYRCLHKDGGWRWISWVASSEDELVYASGRHITAERQAEADLAEAQSALRQSQKMEAIGQLTGGIAHDFNNMLAIVIGSLDIAGRRLQRGDAGIERYLDAAREGANRAAALTQRLLAFSRRSALAPTVTVVNTLVASMSEILRRTLGEQVELETVLAGGIWLAHVDANQLESAILNLAVNARDAMPEGGKLTIETANVYLDDRYASREVGVPAGQYVMIAVTDTGEGMTAEIVEKAFDPFFTTKPVGKGTGLGLSMVYGFAKQSGGHVRVYSERGQGTVVKIYLPRHFGSAEDAATSSSSRAAPAAASEAEVILLVEDDERVREMTVEALQELGYSVRAASSGEEAVKVFADLPHVDVLFTDVVMAGMSGRQLADQLRLATPDLKVLYTTGYTRNAVVHNGVLDADVAFLAKPFSIADLALKLRAVLDG